MGPTKRLLNERTGTIHKPQSGAGNETPCGALRHVPQRHVTHIADAQTRAGDEVERCGRCFEDAGGY